MKPTVGIVDTMIGFPVDPDQLYATMRQQLLRDEESQESLTMPASYMFHDVPEHAADADPVAVTLAEMDRFGVDVGLVSLTAAPEAAERAPDRTPGPVRRVVHVRSEPGHGRHPRSRRRPRDLGGAGGVGVPARAVAAGGDRRPADVSALREVRRARAAAVHDRRHRRPTGSVAVPEGRAARPGDVRLPRARARDAPRCGAVGRSGGEADAQVAEPALLDLGVRARATTRRRSSTTPTPAAPAGSCTAATSRWACRSSAS